jgi:hypothetical protein
MRRDPKALKTVARVRELQRVAAQNKAAAAASVVREAERVLAEHKSQSDASAAGWSSAMQSARLDLMATSLWSVEVLRDEARVRQSSLEVQASLQERERRGADWASAQMRADAATKLADNAGRAKARSKEEAALQTAADRHLNRWSVE